MEYLSLTFILALWHVKQLDVDVILSVWFWVIRGTRCDFEDH